MLSFLQALAPAVTAAQLRLNNREFTVADVKEWVEQTGCMKGRFGFFSTYHANSNFYLQIAKPLLSMRTVGSIDVERKIKPIKETILTKKRNRLKDPRGVALFRASENLKHIMRAKKLLGKQITDSL